METLTLEQANYIGELVAAIVVVISVIYLAMQVKQNTRAMRSATAYSATQMVSSWYQEMGHDTASCKLWMKGLADFDDLSIDEKVQMTMLLHAALLNFQTAFYQSKEDTLDLDMRRSITASIAVVKDTPGFKQVWELRKDLFMEEFGEYMANVIASETSSASIMYEHLVNNEP